MRVSCLVLLLVAGFAGAADDKADRDSRDRKAKAALALAAPHRPAPVAIAPAPRPAPKDYPTGYKDAVKDAKPLVVFVSTRTNWPVDGAECAKMETFPDVAGPAVVVSFPQGGTLFRDAVLPGEPDRKAVEDAVKAAKRKIERPAGKGAPPAAPQPLDWRIQFAPPQPFAYRPAFGPACVGSA